MILLAFLLAILFAHCTSAFRMQIHSAALAESELPLGCQLVTSFSTLQLVCKEKTCLSSAFLFSIKRVELITLLGKSDHCPSATASINILQRISKKIGMDEIVVQDFSEFKLFRDSNCTDNVNIRSLLYYGLLGSKSLESYYSQLGFEIYTFDSYSRIVNEGALKSYRQLAYLSVGRAKIMICKNLLCNEIFGSKPNSSSFVGMASELHSLGSQGDCKSRRDLVRLVEHIKSSGSFSGLQGELNMRIKLL